MLVSFYTLIVNKQAVQFRIETQLFWGAKKSFCKPEAVFVFPSHLLIIAGKVMERKSEMSEHFTELLSFIKVQPVLGC